eukprot:TRINITY_DN174_c0_g1_i2.p1 TRINITY_DN174_c0_g1~~TRINITY_DN174_c0_g1_i2.p1  ORF type:complete len:311 (-),score=95.23 TRINITY_DN174_c0_g1_i2:634-1566(-)
MRNHMVHLFLFSFFILSIIQVIECRRYTIPPGLTLPPDFTNSDFQEYMQLFEEKGIPTDKLIHLPDAAKKAFGVIPKPNELKQMLSLGLLSEDQLVQLVSSIKTDNFGAKAPSSSGFQISTSPQPNKESSDYAEEKSSSEDSVTEEADQEETEVESDNDLEDEEIAIEQDEEEEGDSEQEEKEREEEKEPEEDEFESDSDEKEEGVEMVQVEEDDSDDELAVENMNENTPESDKPNVEYSRDGAEAPAKTEIPTVNSTSDLNAGLIVGITLAAVGGVSLIVVLIVLVSIERGKRARNESFDSLGNRPVFV